MVRVCPSCQVGHLKPIRSVFTRVYDGTLIHAPQVPAWKCDLCGDAFFDTAAIHRIETLLGEAGPPPNRHIPRRAEERSPSAEDTAGDLPARGR
jgi:YgiT-type zinc finger domain-containing protein